jgi:predicted adenylyl cyclase CyaB
MTKNIEVEVRGPLTGEEFEKLSSLLEREGKKTTEKHRVLIDYSTFLPGGIEDRTKDIRVRVTNGVPEIVVKLGSWGGAENRKELAVHPREGEFDTLVEIFGHLGYEKGILAVRNSRVYEYKGIEFALVEVPGHSYYFEAEKMAHEHEDADAVLKELADTCESLGLKVFSKEAFFDYIHTLNKEANEVFEFSSYAPGDFKKKFGV